MTQGHPSPQRLELFLNGQLPREENPSIVRHLVAGCSECATITSRLWEVQVTGRQAPKPRPEEYDEAFDRAWARATALHEEMLRESDGAGARREELLGLAPRQQRLRIRNDPRFQTLAFYRLLIAASEQGVFDDAASACNLAELAQEVLELLDPRKYGLAILADARAESWATLAKGLLTSSDYEAAEAALRTARLHLENGTGSSTEKAKYLSSLAALLISKRRIDEFIEILSELEAIYSKLGDDHMLGRVQLKKAFAFGKKRQPEREIQLLTRALELLDPARDPRRQVIARHNLVLALIDADRPEEADGHMNELRRLHAEQGGHLILLRFRWLEGRLAYAKNQLDQAESLFAAVRDAFIDLEIGIDAALVSLDLAEVLWQQRKVPEMRNRLREAIPILKALGVHGEALAALAFLEHSLRVETASRDLFRLTAAFVRRAQSDPTVRFRPAELVDG